MGIIEESSILRLAVLGLLEIIPLPPVVGQSVQGQWLVHLPQVPSSFAIAYFLSENCASTAK